MVYGGYLSSCEKTSKKNLTSQVFSIFIFEITEMDSLNIITLDRPLRLADQISNQVRLLIQEGQFPVGSKLPSTAKLAGMWGSDVRTVHCAMTALVKEGYLVRKPGSGTVVRKRSEKLMQVAVYCSHEALGIKGSRYTQALEAALAAELREKGLEVRHWVDPRPEAESGEVWGALEAAARRRECQGLIVLSVGLPQLRWLTKLSVPSAFHCSGDIPNKISYDGEQFVELALKTLAEKGCRSVGIISPLPTHVVNKTQLSHSNEEFYKFFVEKAGTHKIEIRNEWMGTCYHEDDLCGISHAQFGYDQFTAIWRAKRKPEALVVYPDSAVEGVLMAIARQGVRVPEDLKLVLHKCA